MGTRTRPGARTCSGAAVLLLAHDAGLTVAGLRTALLSSTDPAPAVAAPASAASAADHTAPGVSLRIDRRTLRTVCARGLRLALGASEACRTRIDVRIDARSARRLHLSSRTIGRASVRLTRAGERAVTVRVSARAARALRAARLRGQRLVDPCVALGR
jgi:hypothetical protein